MERKKRVRSGPEDGDGQGDADGSQHPVHLLEKDMVFTILRAQRAAVGVAKHHIESMDVFLEHSLPQIIMEQPEIQADATKSYHLIKTVGVHIEKPVAKGEGGFFDALEPASARLCRQTYGNPVVVDVEHTIFTAVNSKEKEAGWEAKDAATIDREIQQVEEAHRLGLPIPTSITQRTKPPSAKDRPRRRRPVVDSQQQDWVKSEVRTYRQVNQFTIPTIVGSIGCRTRTVAPLGPNDPHDFGGYGIVKGSEKVIQTQVLLHHNRTFLFKSKSAKYTITAEFRARHDAKKRSTSTLRVHIKTGTNGSGVLRGVVDIPYIDEPVPVLAVCMALGFQTAEEVAICAATGGVLSGLTPIPAGSSWDTHAVHTTKQWILALLHDDEAIRGAAGAPSASAAKRAAVAAVAAVAAAASASASASGPTAEDQGAGVGGSRGTGGCAGAVETTPPPPTATQTEGGRQFEGQLRSKVLQWIGERDQRPNRTAERCAKSAAHAMANEFLPNLGLNSSATTVARKGQFMCMILRWCADAARGIIPLDDRDHAGNRQYELDGSLFSTFTRQLYRNHRKKAQSETRRYAESGRFVGIPRVLAMKRATDGFTYSMCTGKWGPAKAGSSQTGVVQLQNRSNQIATQSHLRRLDSALKREGKQTAPRQLHVSHWGHVCPAETPEGPACGLVTQMAAGVIMCQGHVSKTLITAVSGILAPEGLVPLLDEDTLLGNMALLLPMVSFASEERRNLRPILLDHCADDVAAVRASKAANDAAVSSFDQARMARVLVNGIMIGFVGDLEKAAATLRGARRRGRLPYDVAVEGNSHRGTLMIAGEAGCMRRPLFVLDWSRGDGDGLKHVRDIVEECAMCPPDTLWWTLVARGAVEYVSKHEEENALVLVAPTGEHAVPHAALRSHTHCEIHPSQTLGVSAGAIPLSDHNQAPRTSYFAAMCKQTAATPPPEACYTNGLRLWYPQAPLVTTWGAKLAGVVDAPMGCNAWVLVASLDGCNQEDSLCFNEDSTARGLFGVTVNRTFTEDCVGGEGADAQQFQLPPPWCEGHKTDNYSKLGPGGMLRCREHVGPGDAIIGKIMHTNEVFCEKRSTVTRDQSQVLHGREGHLEVEDVFKVRGRDDRELAVVRTHAVRFLQEGDKLTTVSGQKGVVGRMKPACRMPFCPETGIVMDVVVNPHSIPSRMTMGMLLEAVLGRACAEDGTIADGTPFNLGGAATVEAALLEAGFIKAGELDPCSSTIINGETGKPMAGVMFHGCLQYQRVKQMVDDKYHARATGPESAVTRQPTEGKSKEGGLRFGDMERDAVQGHGAAAVATDRLFQQSDYALIPVCTGCGEIAEAAAPAEVRPFVVGRNEVSGYCAKCAFAGKVRMVPMPYGNVAWTKENAACHIRTQFHVNPNPIMNPHTSAAVGVKRISEAYEAGMMAPDAMPTQWSSSAAGAGDMMEGGADGTENDEEPGEGVVGMDWWGQSDELQ